MTNVLSADNSKLRPATVATFIKRWGTVFNTAINNPSPWDYIGAGAGVTFGALAKAMAAEGTAARLMDINVSNIGMVPSIAQSGVKNGASGAMAELGAGAVALLAGWGTDAVTTAALIPFLPEALVGAFALAGAAGVSYLAGKAITSSIDTFNALTRQASSSGQPIVATLQDGATVTINADKSCAVVQNGNVYYFTARGDLTASYIASAGLWLNIDGQIGTMVAADSMGTIVGSTNLQVDARDNLIILDPFSGSQLGFLFSSDNGSLAMTDPNGDQTVILHAQPDRNPAVFRFNDNGLETMTSISADGGTLSSEVIMVAGDTTTPIYTLESVFNADGSISTLRNYSDGTELTSYYDALTGDTTSDWNNLETGKSGTLVTESNGNQLATWDNDDGTHGTVSYDATNQNLNMDWINADQSSVTLISDPQGIAETDFDSNGNKTGDTWSNAGGICATDPYNLDGTSSTTDGTDDHYNGTATAMDDSAIIDNYSTDNPSAGDNWFSPDGNSDGDIYSNTNNAYRDN